MNSVGIGIVGSGIIACRTTPGGIHSNVSAHEQPYPLFYDRSQGSHAWDVDGNEYHVRNIDFMDFRFELCGGTVLHSIGVEAKAADT